MTDGDVSRRQFLRAAGTATLTAAIGGSASAAPTRGMMAQAAIGEAPADRKIRVGVVGGGFGAAFQWHLDPNCIVEAVSDLRTDRREHLRKVYKCDKSYESLEKLILDDNIDAVAVFTGAPDHVRHCVAVMDTGKHCMCAEVSAFMGSWSGQPFVIKREGESDITSAPDYLHLLPEPMRIRTGHGNSHAFLTHEFIMALVQDRKPSVDVYTAVAETAPGIVAHESALKGGELLKVPSFDPQA